MQQHWPLTRGTDAAAVVALLVLGMAEVLTRGGGTNRAELAADVVAYTVPLLWRRRAPVPVLAVVVVAGPVVTAATPQGGVVSYVLAAILASYSVGRLLDRPATWWGPALAVGLNYLFVTTQPHPVATDYVFIALIYGSAWAVGYALRQRTSSIERLSQEADELRARQEARAAEAVADERVRIARELHDIVTHSLTVVTIQTQAVRRRLRTDQPEEAADLRSIEATAREALAEMRRLLGVLRAEGEPLALAPQPGLQQLDRLVQSARATGLDVQVTTTGEAVPLGAGVDLAAYRVVQEALTNVRKHSRARHVDVRLAWGRGVLTVAVADDGGPSVPDAAGEGHGLIGMKERAGVFGGTLEAHRGERGFVVTATLPVGQPATTT